VWIFGEKLHHGSFWSAESANGFFYHKILRHKCRDFSVFSEIIRPELTAEHGRSLSLPLSYEKNVTSVKKDDDMKNICYNKTIVYLKRRIRSGTET